MAGPEPGAGRALFGLRRRGRAIEGVICELLAPGGDRAVARALLRRVVRLAQPDYLIRLGAGWITRDGFAHLPRMGPVLACRPLAGTSTPPLKDWALTMGDVELL